ncbi:helix-turn-helix domain-containing protein [Cellulomonas sp. P5_E12]
MATMQGARGPRRTSSLLGDYLRARRGMLQPEDVGLFRYGGRRVGGLRRQEVADLAGVSTDYYLRLEQGRDRQPSDQVIVALARALRVGDFGIRHMRRLVQLQNQGAAPIRRTDIDGAVGSLMDFWQLTPVAVVDSNLDIVAANDIAQVLDEGLLSPRSNLVLGLFERQDHTADGWLEKAERVVADLRFRCDPDDVRLQEIVGRLSIREPIFRRLWASHDSQPFAEGLVRSTLEELGRFTFRFQSLDLPSIDGCSVLAFHPADEAAQAAISSIARHFDHVTSASA